VYDSEIFAPAIKIIEKNIAVENGGGTVKEIRILAEHTRAAAIIIADGVIPSASGQGYVLRRLVRRAVRMANKLGCSNSVYAELTAFYRNFFDGIYNIPQDIVKIFLDEVGKFQKTIKQGIKEFNKASIAAGSGELSGSAAFRLYETYGFPIELTAELAAEAGISVNMKEYEEARRRHSEQSHTASAGMFKGGLSDISEDTANLHTATHLLLAGLKKLLGPNVRQKGSNITPERLRFDFNCDRKLNVEELKFLEDFVNKSIQKKLPVICRQMSLNEAKRAGAEGVFLNRYGDTVKVYTVGHGGDRVSCEICGGPHAENTADLGYFKIVKEESSGVGIRRIKAVLE
jgi:alanyl-tRNA synthetase